jgi:hypothetical protein
MPREHAMWKANFETTACAAIEKMDIQRPNKATLMQLRLTSLRVLAKIGLQDFLALGSKIR